MFEAAPVVPAAMAVTRSINADPTGKVITRDLTTSAIPPVRRVTERCPKGSDFPLGYSRRRVGGC